MSRCPVRTPAVAPRRLPGARCLLGLLLAGACARVDPPAPVTVRALPPSERENVSPPAGAGAAARRPPTEQRGLGPDAPPPSGPSAELLTDLTVEQALVLALRNDPELQVRTFGPVEAGTFTELERGVFDPELFVEARYLRERASQTARATRERFDVTGESSEETIGVRQQFPTGTTLELLLRHRLDVSDRTPPQNEARIGLSVTQSLLRGLGPAVNLAAIRQAELESRASFHLLQAFTASVLAETEIAYWTLALAQAEEDTVRRALEVAEQEAAALKDRVEVGLLPEVDRAAAEAEVAARRQALVDAVARREAAELRLEGRIARRFDAPVKPSSPVQAGGPAVEDLRARVVLALERRPELGEARARLEQGELEVVVTENGLLPRLDAFVDLGKTGFDARFGGALAQLDSPTFDLQAGLSLSYALGQRAAGARYSRAQVSRRRSRIALENLERQIRLEVRLAANELERARGQVVASEATRDARAATVEAEKARLEVGTGTALALAQARRDLLDSELAVLRAAVDTRVATVRLYLAEGTLLPRRGIVVED